MHPGWSPRKRTDHAGRPSTTLAGSYSGPSRDGAAMLAHVGERTPDQSHRSGDGGGRPAHGGGQHLLDRTPQQPHRGRSGRFRRRQTVPDARERCARPGAGRTRDTGGTCACAVQARRAGTAASPHLRSGASPAGGRPLAGPRAGWRRPSARPIRRADGERQRPIAEPPHQPAGTRAPITETLDVGVRAINSTADRRARPAHGPVRRLRRRQERAARHDGALHQRRRDRGRPDRRTRPRSQGIHRPHSGQGRSGARGRGGRAGRCLAPDAPAGRRLCHLPSPNISATRASTCC